eukprot:scaffold34604_cov88-Skeletonema_dohrnii-CCMP3373.AAC.3
MTKLSVMCMSGSSKRQIIGLVGGCRSTSKLVIGLALFALLFALPLQIHLLTSLSPNTANKKNDGEDEEDDGIPHYAKEGVDPIYINLFKDAKIRSDSDYKHSHREGKRGIVIGPTEGNFKRNT